MNARNVPDISRYTSTVLVDRSEKKDDQCPICYTDYEDTVELLQHSVCKHTFCPECFFRATEAHNNNKCPMCRQKFYKPAIEVHKEELARRRYTRDVESEYARLRQILSDIEQRIKTDERIAEATRTPFSFVLPYPALMVILKGSKKLLEQRIARFGSPSRPTSIHRLNVLAQGLGDARNSFQTVLDILTSQPDSDQNIQSHFMAAYSQL